MIAEVQGRVYTNQGNFLWTSRHCNKSRWPWARRDFFVGYWESNGGGPVILSKLRGGFIVERWMEPKYMHLGGVNIDEINRLLEDARRSDATEVEPDDLCESLREQ